LYGKYRLSLEQNQLHFGRGDSIRKFMWADNQFAHMMRNLYALKLGLRLAQALKCVDKV